MASNAARFFLFCAGALVLGGCGSGTGASNAVLPLIQSTVTKRGVLSDRSWMSAGAKYEDLIYAADGDANSQKVFVLSLRTGKVVGNLGFADSPWGPCNDDAGHVFITHFHQYGRVAGEVDEYDHGGTTPIAKMSLPKSESATCSVDPATGDLAIASSSFDGPDIISIFSPPLGNGARPQKIDAPGTIALSPYCSYDGHGDLFLMVEQQVGSNYPQWFLDELPAGGKTLVPVSLTGVGGFTQWHGSYLAIGLQNINHVKVSGGNGRVVGSTKLSGKQRNFGDGSGVFWIDRNVIVAPFNYPRSHIRDGTHDLVGVWSYPSGSQITTSRDFGAYELVGVTISRALKQP